MNVDHRQELLEGDPPRITAQVVDWDYKRMHLFQTMYHASKGYLAATNEVLFVHVNTVERRSAPFPDAVQAELAEITTVHEALGVPDGAFRTLGIPAAGHPRGLVITSLLGRAAKAPL